MQEEDLGVSLRLHRKKILTHIALLQAEIKWRNRGKKKQGSGEEGYARMRGLDEREEGAKEGGNREERD